MADSTFGVKVPDELKEQLTKLMQNSGLTGKDFMQSLVNVYQVEKTKEGIPEVAQDLKELQSLTQRINNIYLNLGYRIDNLMKSKETELQEQLQRKDTIVSTLQNKIEELDSESEMLTEAFNTSVNDKNELETRVNELTESNSSIKALNEEYKSKFDTMAGIVEEYKHYKIEVEEYKKLLADSQSKNIELENTLKDKDFELSKLNDTVSDLKVKNETDLDALNAKHKDEIISLTNRIKANEELHKYDIQVIKDKAEFEKEKALLGQDRKHQESINKLNDEHAQKVKELLNLLEESKTQHQEPQKKPTFYGKCRKCGTHDDWQFIKAYDKDDEHHEVLKCNSCGNEVDVLKDINDK